ncbi:(2,3-dihydroxybenzoyl)adenylate synthase [Amycolatopsis jejuensis]|uniref:(2,3-dihydroxybenzoyl)adenylate synthase n=1 Tax=Amycolatopsis jejuensis TaxID=330084 RepID=UPI001FE1D1F4|nr:AMP-binding protein [Amycolatopsis jejuensis]
MTLPTPAAPVVPYDEVSVLAYRRARFWTGRSLPAELWSAARRHGRRTALISEGTTWTYDELFGTAARFAAGLREVVRAGEPVMFQTGNVAETVVAYLGCLAAGAPPVCTLPQHGTREIGLLARHVGARTLITQADFRDGRLRKQAEQLLAEGAIADVVVCRGEALGATPTYEALLKEEPQEPCKDFDSAQPAVFQLSGGTTGLPKVAPRLHEEYAYNARAWATALRMHEHTRLLYPLPLMHNAGISLALQPAIFAGATLILAPSADVDVVLDLIAEHRPDVLPLVPPALAVRLLEAPRTEDLSCLRDFVVGGQRLPVEVAERLRDELGIRLRQMFGMAEGMFLLTPDGADEAVRHHTVGAPISAADEVRILDPVSEDEVPDGEVGEFAARGPYTIRGYYRAAEHNRNAFTPDGFYRTGDLARRHVTAAGVCYSIEGRIKDVINRGVEKIFAEEVEEIIVQHPDVVTAALVAMPDPVLGERACAYLVMEDGASPLTVETLGAHLLGRGLAKYKLPERVEVVPALPLTNVGKVAKNRLREDVQAKLEAR